MKKHIITIVIFLWSTFAFSQSDFNKAGRTAFQFLKIGIGARSAALGESGIASMNDVNSVFWNPAAITGFQGTQTSFDYTKWIADLNITSAAIGYNFEGIGSFALSYNSLNYGQLQEALVTSPTGNVDTRTGSSFSGSDLMVGLSYSRQFTDKLSIGLTGKYLREDLFTYSSSLFAFDVGTYYNTGWHGIRLAMSAQNLGSPARWLNTGQQSQQSYDLPIIFRIGWAIDLLGGKNFFFGGDPSQHKITFSMDGVHSNDYGERVLMGLEYTAYDIFSFRVGYRFNYTEGNLSFGAGFNYNVGSVLLRFDYAYVVYDYLESPHRLSVIITF
ncbi:MAG: PorV/PorQ family protein [Ignavibacteriaceae bacterium]